MSYNPKEYPVYKCSTKLLVCFEHPSWKPFPGWSQRYKWHQLGSHLAYGKKQTLLTIGWSGCFGVEDTFWDGLTATVSVGLWGILSYDFVTGNWFQCFWKKTKVALFPRWMQHQRHPQNTQTYIHIYIYNIIFICQIYSISLLPNLLP